MIYEAHELQHRFQAGLQLVGQNADGELEWMGEREQFFAYEKLRDAYAAK